MGLYDIDKNSEDRGTPMPNTNDKIIEGAIKSHKTLSTHYTTDADTNPGRLQMQNKQIIGNDGTTPITLYGYNQALNKWGFFVTKPGVDVTTNTDLSQFIFNSSQDILKVVAKGTTTIPSFGVGSGQINYAQLTIAHGLSFTPLVNIYAKGNILNASLGLIASSYIPLPFTPPGGTGAGTTVAALNSYYFPAVSSGNSYALGMTYGIDATNIYINVGSTVTSAATADTIAAIPITYFLLQETAT